MSLLSRLTVEFPFSPGGLKTGFETKDRSAVSLNYLLALMKGRSTLVSIATEYIESYKAAPAKTVLHYRDFLLSEALLESLVNVQYKDKTKTLLTQASQRVWDNYSYDEVWRYLAPNSSLHLPSYKIADVLGSVAFYFKSVSLETYYPQEILEAALRYIWFEVGLDYSLPVNQRLNQLVQNLGLNSALFEKISAAIPQENKPLVQALRREGFTVGAISNLQTKVFLGEYSDLELSLRSSLFIETERERFNKTLAGCTKVLRPSGLPLVLQAIAIEGLLKATQTIQRLPADLLKAPLDSFRSLVSQRTTFYQIALDLTTAYDAYQLLAQYETLSEASKKARSVAKLIYYWLSVSGLDSLAEDLPGRASLSTFYKVREITLTDAAVAVDPFFSILQEQAPKGDPTNALILSVLEQSTSATTVSVTDIYGKPKEASLSTIFNRDLNVSIVDEPSIGVFVLEGSGLGSASIIATPVGGELPTLDDYLSSAEGVVASNPVTVTSPEAFASVSAGVEEQIIDLVDLYQTAFGLSSTTSPRGSDEDLYRKNGVPSPNSSDYRSIIDSFKDKIYGARTENTSRIVALYENVSDHLEDAIAKAMAWTESLQSLNSEEEEEPAPATTDDTTPLNSDIA